jgi:ankyrin repeat protein
VHYAVEGGYAPVVALLIREGADVNAHDERVVGNTPLGEVAAACSLEMAAMLIDAGADPTIPGWMQLTALDKACQRERGDGPSVCALLRKAAESPRSSD